MICRELGNSERVEMRFSKFNLLRQNVHVEKTTLGDCHCCMQFYSRFSDKSIS